MRLELRVLELLHAVGPDQPRLAQTLGQRTEIGLGFAFAATANLRPAATLLAVHPPDEHQRQETLQAQPPVDCQQERQERDRFQRPADNAHEPIR